MFAPSLVLQSFGIQCREKSLLHCIFRHDIVAQSEDGVFEKIVAVIVQPTFRIWRLVGGLSLCLAHGESGSVLANISLRLAEHFI